MFGVDGLDFGSRQLVGRGLRVVSVAAGYYVSALLGTILSIPPFGFAVIWPATAFLIAILIITPMRGWWMYLGAVVLAHFHLVSTFQNSDPPFLVMLSQIVGNIGLAVATVLAVQRAAQPLKFDNFRTVFRFVLLGGFVIPAVGNALVLCLHLLTGWTDAFWLSWRQWMLASIFPTITIPPLVAIAHARRWRTPAEHSRALELALVLVPLIALAFGVFSLKLGPTWWPVLLLAPLPLLLWAVVRLGVGGACLSLLAFAAVVIAHALNKSSGSFIVNASRAEVLSLEVCLILIAAPLILLAALIEERRRIEATLKEMDARIKVVAAATDTGLWQWDEAKQALWTTDHCRVILGAKPDISITPEGFLSVVHEEDRARIQAALARMLISADMQTLEWFRIVKSDGDIRWLVGCSHAEFDESRRPIRVSGMFRDVTEHVAAKQEADALAQRLLTVQEDERRSIARDLHDSTAQDLVAVGLSLRVLSRQIPLSEDTSRTMDEIIKSVYQATKELRTFVFLLRPSGLDGDHVCSVLEGYADGFGRRTGLKITLRTSPMADRLPLDTQRALLRIFQESLTNVHRHAGAARVSVNLRHVSNVLHLVIADDGEGMSLSEQRRPVHAGLGIPGMTARVRQLGGEFSIRSDASGTVIHAAIPFVADAVNASCESPNSDAAHGG